MIRVATALALLTAVASADTQIQLPDSKAQIVLPDRWDKAAVDHVALSYKHPSGSLLVVTRTDAPNPDAWSDTAKTREAYADAIERGLAKSIEGYKRTRRKLAKANGVPALDIEATRTGGATVIVRALLFHTYGLTLAIEVPAKGDIAVARRIASAFAPPAS